jgi:hypothetical protein
MIAAMAIKAAAANPKTFEELSSDESSSSASSESSSSSASSTTGSHANVVALHTLDSQSAS